jgi:hypothetical protein
LFAYQSVVEARLKDDDPSELLRREQIAAPYEEWGHRHN